MRKSILLFALLLLIGSGSVLADNHDGDMSMGFPYSEGGVAAGQLALKLPPLHSPATLMNLSSTPTMATP